jgi:hypothetical protein
MTFSKMTLSIKGLFVKLIINDIHHNNTLFQVPWCWILECRVSHFIYWYAECRYAERHFWKHIILLFSTVRCQPKMSYSYENSPQTFFVCCKNAWKHFEISFRAELEFVASLSNQHHFSEEGKHFFFAKTKEIFWFWLKHFVVQFQDETDNRLQEMHWKSDM